MIILFGGAQVQFEEGLNPIHDQLLMEADELV